MDELSQRRMAHNQALFRTVNEQIESRAVDSSSISFVCECSDADCLERLDLSAPEYEAARLEARWFIVKPGHHNPELELLVSQGERYAIVEKKLAVAIEIAEATDPRN